MRFFSTAVSVALAAFAAIVAAQTEAPMKNNAITHPLTGETINAGSSYTIQWINQAGGPVTLTLMDGPVNDPNGLKPIATIVSGAPNSGSYTWKVPSNLPASQTYAIRISYDSNPNNYNYSGRFIFNSSVTASATTASSTAPPTTTSAPATTSTTEMTTETSTTSSESTTSAPTSANSTTTMGTSTRLSSTSTRRSSTSASTSQPTDGAPPSAASSTLSSPLVVIMAVLAAALFIH